MFALSADRLARNSRDHAGAKQGGREIIGMGWRTPKTRTTSGE
jgi:hypothetical protein